MKKFIKSCIEDFKKVPSWLVAMSLITTLLMNILANKTLYSDSSFMSVDCGTTVSWVMFLVMDIVTQRYGGKSSFAVTIFDVVVTLFMSGIMCLVAIVPESSVSGWFQGEEGAEVLNNLIGNNYLVVLTSLFAFVCASLVDIVSNITFGKWLNKTRVFKGQNNKRTVKGFFIYFVRAYGSTFLSQFVDNFVFQIIAYPLLFNMPCSFTSILVGALLCAIVELVIELIFAPIGYIATTNRESEKVEQKTKKEDVISTMK